MTLHPTSKLIYGALGTFAFIGLWLVLSMDSQSLFLPPLHVMLLDAWTYWSSPDGLRDISVTLSNLGWGLVLGVVAGGVAGLMIGQIPFLDRAFTPLIEFGRAVPQVALMPFAISLLGIGNEMKVFIIALSAFWPVLLNVSEGIKHVPGQWVDTGVSFGLSPLQRELFIILPALLPRLLTGVHIALPLCLIVAVTSEMIGENTGIGSTILNAQYTYEVSRMWSGVLILGVIGCLLNLLCILPERALKRWNPER